VSVALASWALYRLARTLELDGRAALLLALAFLAHPAVPAALAGVFGYHEDVRFPLFFWLAYDALQRGRAWRFAGWFLFSLALHERFALVWVAIGAIWALGGRRRPGLTVALLAAAWFALATFVVMPAASGGARAWFLRGASPASRLPEALGEGTAYAGAHLADAGLVAALSPLSLAAAPMVASFVQGWVSGYTQPLAVDSWHAYTVIPVLFLGAIDGMKRIEARTRRWVAVLIAAAILAWNASECLLRTTPCRSRPLSAERREAAEACLALVGPSESVSASLGGLGAHLTHRRQLWLFPERSKANVVVIEPALEDAAAVAALASDAAFRRVFDRGGFAVYERCQRR
jgi:uncharacterized membrane protein